MIRTLPRIDFVDELQLEGAFSGVAVGDVAVSCKCTRRKYHHDAHIDFTAQTRNGDRGTLRHLIERDRLTFRGKLYGCEFVQAECIPLRSQDGAIEGIVNQLDIGSFELSSHPSSQTVQVQFTPCPVAESQVEHQEFYWTGEIRSRGAEPEFREAILKTPLGLGRFSTHFEFEKAKVDDATAYVRTPVPTFSMAVNNECLTNDLHGLFEKVSDLVGPLEVLLSFLSRRQVRWTQMELFSEEAHEKGVKCARRIRTIHGSAQTPDLLIVPLRLDGDDLNTMLEALNESHYKEPIEHAVNYLNSHWREDFIEGEFGNAFICFETLVNGISSVDKYDKTVPGSMFRRMSQELKEHIRKFAVDNNVSEDRTGELKDKVSELQRRPIVPRAVELIEHYDVRWQDLWPAGADLRTELSEAYKRRSSYIHQGRIDNHRLAMRDSQRVHTLSERLVYQLIGGQKEWLHPFAYDHLRWLSSDN